jgi:ribosomal subunit interface protein
MQVPLQIVFKNIRHSDSVAAKVRERVAWLERFFDHCISCRVVIDMPHKHQRRGNDYHVMVDLHVPGEELVVSREADYSRAKQDVYAAIHDAFDGLRRELQEYVRRMRGKVKVDDAAPHASVQRIIPGEEGYGFIRDETGRELYFDRKSVLHNRFDQLKVGTEVRFSEEMGDEGPQASTVELVGKQGREFLKGFDEVA